MDVVKAIKDLNVGNVIENPLMKKYTTYKVGGEALCIVSPYNTEALIKLLQFLDKNVIKYKILGNGSNLIFSEKKYNGVLIKLDEFDTLYIDDTKVTVGAGYSLMHLALKVSRLGLSGLEFATGIPGSVGGAVFMNAGAYQSDMGYIVHSIKVLTPDYKVKTLYNSELDFHYRHSFLQENPKYICLEASINLQHGNKDDIMTIIEDRKKRRLESQPLEYPSAGSVFRNPENNYAGKLIEEVNLKGYSIGDAMVSEKHANFIINKGNTTGDDVIKLIKLVQDKVYKEKGIKLKVEQEIVK